MNGGADEVGAAGAGTPSPRPDPAASAHVFVADLDGPELDDDDRHHLGRVLRLRIGERVTVGDGAGSWRAAVWTGSGVDPTGEVQRVARPGPPITIAFALTKGDKPELVVQKLTEVGVDDIVAFPAARSVVRWDDDRRTRHLHRLERVVREAAMQSRRAWLPTVSIAASFAAVARHPGAALADLDGDPPSLARPVVLVGPEGGWSDDERATVTARVGLGDAVLRAETAALTAGALLTALRSGLVDTPGTRAAAP